MRANVERYEKEMKSQEAKQLAETSASMKAILEGFGREVDSALGL